MALTRKRLAIGVLVLVVGSFVVHRVFFPSDERRIERTIEQFATSSNPSLCDEKATDAYLEQSTGAEPPFADEICEVESEPATDSVDVSEVSVDGDSATALVAYSGGYFDGAESELRLVEEDGVWKVDRRLSIAHLDRTAFRSAYRESFREFGSPDERVRCAMSREAELSDADVRRSVLEQSGAVFTRIAVACDRPGVEREVRGSLAHGGLSSAGAACVDRRLATVGAARLARMQVDLPIYGRLVTDCDRDAVVRFTRRESIAGGDDTEETACLVSALRALPPVRQFRLTYEDDRYEALYDRCRE